MINHSNLKILFIHNSYLQSAGGEDTTVEAEIELLRSRGHEIQLLLFQNSDVEASFKDRVTTAVSAIYNKNSVQRLKVAIADFHPEIIHVHNFFFTASPSVIIQAVRSNVPVVVTLQNFRLICANAMLLRNNNVCELCIHSIFPWYGVKYKCYHDSAIQSAVVGSVAAIHKIFGTWHKKVNRFITPSQFARNKLLNSSLKLAEDRIAVKRNFINETEWSPRSERKQHFLFVGRLSAEKGVRYLLETFKKLVNHQIIIVGDGPQRNELENEFGNLQNIRFEGKKDKTVVLKLMRECKALLFPSIWYEGLPLTIIEALASGTPVLASRLGAMEEMIVDGQNGLLFEPGNVASIASVILQFDDHQKREDFSMYDGARASYLKNFHPDKCYEDSMKIYESVLAEHRSVN